MTVHHRPYNVPAPLCGASDGTSSASVSVVTCAACLSYGEKPPSQ